MNNIVQFPTQAVQARIKHKAFVTRNYLDACKLFDKYRESHLVTDSAVDKQFAQHWHAQSDYWADELEKLGGALC